MGSDLLHNRNLRFDRGTKPEREPRGIRPRPRLPLVILNARTEDSPPVRQSKGVETNKCPRAGRKSQPPATHAAPPPTTYLPTHICTCARHVTSHPPSPPHHTPHTKGNHSPHQQRPKHNGVPDRGQGPRPAHRALPVSQPRGWGKEGRTRAFTLPWPVVAQATH